MTLIIGSGNSQRICLVADRRYSRPGGFFEDEKTKSTIVVCQDARLAAGFSGLAEYQQFRTEQWLLQALHECAAPDYCMGPMLSRLAEIATRDFGKLNLPPAQKRLSIIFAGYQYVEKPPIMCYSRISNYEYPDESTLAEAQQQFSTTFWKEIRPLTHEPTFIITAGNPSGLDRTGAEQLRTLQSTNAPVDAVIGKSVELIRAAADNPRSSGTVGKQCLSIMLPVNLTSEPTTGYHSATVSYSYFMPNIVIATPGHEATAMSITFSAVDPEGPQHAVAFPKVRRNAPCPCKSGKKYKHCHGRRVLA